MATRHGKPIRFISGYSKCAPEIVLIAITHGNGSLAIMQFVTKQARTLVVTERGISVDPGWSREPTKEAIEAEIARTGLTAVEWRFTRIEEIPADRTFREAFRDTGQGIDVDMDRARDIHLASLREARVERLRALDDEERAPGADLADIEARKQVLRDITKAVPTAATPEDLKAIQLP